MRQGLSPAVLKPHHSIELKNLIPTATGNNFSLTARFYAPQGDLLAGKWQLPKIKKIDN